MTEIYLIRHTQAEGNLYRAMQGHWDGDVTALGLREIELLAERFRGVKLDALYSSDLKRAVLTARGVGRYAGLEPVKLPELREINVGPWESRFFADAAFEDPERMELFIHRAEAFSLDGAESYHEVRRRASAALVGIAERNDGKSVAVVSHGVTIRCLLSFILGKSLDDPSLPICGNTGVCRLLYSGGSFTVDYINDCSHLDALGAPRWGASENLRGEAIEPMREKDFYRACYADAWRAAHGTLDGFEPEGYLRSAQEHFLADRGAVIKIWSGDREVGLVDLDPLRGAHAGYGWVSLLYLRGEYRGRGLGIQLLGRAMMRFSALGRRSVRLHVAADNAPALRFYEKHGFRRLSTESGALGDVYLMEFRYGESHV